MLVLYDTKIPGLESLNLLLHVMYKMLVRPAHTAADIDTAVRINMIRVGLVV